MYYNSKKSPCLFLIFSTLFVGTLVFTGNQCIIGDDKMTANEIDDTYILASLFLLAEPQNNDRKIAERKLQEQKHKERILKCLSESGKRIEYIAEEYLRYFYTARQFGWITPDILAKIKQRYEELGLVIVIAEIQGGERLESRGRHHWVLYCQTCENIMGDIMPEKFITRVSDIYTTGYGPEEIIGKKELLFMKGGEGDFRCHVAIPALDASPEVREIKIISILCEKKISKLISFLSNDNLDLRKYGFNRLKEITRKEFNFNPEGTVGERKKSIQEWEVWLKDNQLYLYWDNTKEIYLINQEAKAAGIPTEEYRKTHPWPTDNKPDAPKDNKPKEETPK